MLPKKLLLIIDFYKDLIGGEKIYVLKFKFLLKYYFFIIKLNK